MIATLHPIPLRRNLFFSSYMSMRKMNYCKSILFIICLLVFQSVNAQVDPNSYIPDSVQKMINNIRDNIKGYKDLKEIPGIPQFLPFIDSNS